MTSLPANKHLSSFIDSTRSESHKRSFQQPSNFLIGRPRAFTDPAYRRPSHNKVYKTSEAGSTCAVPLGDYLPTKHIHPYQDQRDEWITRTEIGISRSNLNECNTKSPIGVITDQVYQYQPQEFTSAFDRLHAMPEDRHYLLERFFAEEDRPSTRIFDEGSKGSSYVEGDVGISMYPPPKRRRTSLDTNLLMIGAFAEDFDEYITL